MKNDLASPMYKDAHQKYSSKIIENKTTEIVNGDLQKYYGAMDKAIMMWEIRSYLTCILNWILYQLWKRRYFLN